MNLIKRLWKKKKENKNDNFILQKVEMTEKNAKESCRKILVDNVKVKENNKPVVSKSFMDSCTFSPSFDSIGSIECSSFINMPSTKYESKHKAESSSTKLNKNSVIVKINALPSPVDGNRNFKFVGISQFDGYNIYEYIGNNPREITNYPYEEMRSFV